MNTKQVWLLFGLFLFTVNCTIGQGFEKRWEELYFENLIAVRNFDIIDINNDGKKELIYSNSDALSNSQDDLVIREIDEDYLPLLAYFPDITDSIDRFFYSDIDGDQNIEILILYQNSDLSIYDGKTFDFQQTIHLDLSAPGSYPKFDQLDDQLGSELITYSPDSVRVYRYESGGLLWLWSYQGGKNGMVAGDFDGDHETELLIMDADSNSLLSGNSGRLEMKLPPISFLTSDPLILDVTGDSISEIITLTRSWPSSNAPAAYDFQQPDTFLWVNDLARNSNRITLLNTNGDSEKQLGVLSAFSDLSLIDLEEGFQYWWQIANADYIGIRDLAAIDIDQDGKDELLYAFEARGNRPGLASYNPRSQQEIKRWFTKIPNFSTLALPSNNGNSQFANFYKYEQNVFVDLYDPVTNLRDTQLLIGAHTFDFTPPSFAIGNITNDTSYQFCYSENATIHIYQPELGQAANSSFSIGSSRIVDLVVEDLDRNGLDEIITVHSNGDLSVTAYQASTDSYAVLQTIQTGLGISKLKIRQADDDDQLEIIVDSKFQNRVIVFDSQSLNIEWDGQNTSINISTMDVADMDQDGQIEFVIGSTDGKIYVLNPLMDSILSQRQVLSSSIKALAIEHFNDNYQYKDILCIGAETELILLEDNQLNLGWQSPPMLKSEADDNIKLQVTNIDHDRYPDIIFNNGLSVKWLESNVLLPNQDIFQVKQFYPPFASERQAVNTSLLLTFSSPLADTVLNQNYFAVSSSQGVLDVNIIKNNDSLHIQPLTNWTPLDTIHFEISGLTVDQVGRQLDGNSNGLKDSLRSEDDFYYFFTTGSGIDTVPPHIVELASNNRDSLFIGSSLKLTGKASDYSTIAAGAIQEVEYFEDNPGIDGSGIPLLALDGQFDQEEENFIVTVSSRNWSPGEKKLFVHAKDSLGNWGDFDSIQFFVVQQMASDWATYGQSNFRNYHDPNSQFQMPLALDWVTIHPNHISTHLPPTILTVGEKTILSYNSYDRSTYIRCFNNLNGEELWQTYLGNRFSMSEVSYAYDKVYVMANSASDQTDLICLDISDGIEVWRRTVFGPFSNFRHSLTIVEGKALIRLENRLLSFDTSTGAEIYDVFTSRMSPDLNIPTAYNNILYEYNSGGNTLVEWDTETGALNWESNNLGDGPRILFVQNSALIDTFNQQVVCANKLQTIVFDLKNRQEQFRINEETQSFPILYNNELIYITSSGLINAYNASSGQLSWSIPMPTNGKTITSQPIIASDDLFYCTFDPFETISINLSTLQHTWSYPVNGQLSSGNNQLFVRTNEEFFVFTDDSTSFNAAFYKPKWEIDSILVTGKSINKVDLHPDNGILWALNTVDNQLYRIKQDSFSNQSDLLQEFTNISFENLAVTSKGDLLLGTSNNFLFKYDGDWEQFDQTNGLNGKSINSISVNQDYTLVGTENGLYESFDNVSFNQRLDSLDLNGDITIIALDGIQDKTSTLLRKRINSFEQDIIVLNGVQNYRFPSNVLTSDPLALISGSFQEKWPYSCFIGDNSKIGNFNPFDSSGINFQTGLSPIYKVHKISDAYYLIGTEDGLYITSFLGEGFSPPPAFPVRDCASIPVYDITGNKDLIWLATKEGLIKMKRAEDNCEINSPTIFYDTEKNSIQVIGVDEGSFTWYIDDVEQIGFDNNHFTPVKNGIYRVEIISCEGCSSSLRLNYFSTSTQNLPSPVQLMIYPNPSRNEFQLYLKNSQQQHPINLSLWSLEGKVVLEDIELQLPASLSIKSLPAGMYLLKANSADQHWIQKVVIEK